MPLRLLGFSYYSYLRRVLDLYEIDQIIDVGANKGQFRDLMRHDLDFSGKIVSFEPIQYLSNALAARAAKDGNWVVMPYALGSAPGTAILNVTQSLDLSSVLEPRTLIEDLADAARVVAREEVRVETLTGLVQSKAIDPGSGHSFLKIDTQGFDLEVLKGAERILTMYPILHIELSFMPLYLGAPTYSEVIEWITSRGYSIGGVFPVSYAPHGELMDADVLFVRAE